jgi:hypothetical protein
MSGGTAVTQLAPAERTEAEISTITGHTLRDVRSILDAHYPIAIRRLPKVPFASSKREQKFPMDLPIGPNCSSLFSVKLERTCVINGGRTRTRTLDPLIKSQLLYQLSYAP